MNAPASRSIVAKGIMIDASPVDALCMDGRHSSYGCMDIATRRIAITVSKPASASAVAVMIRKAIGALS